MPSTSAHHTDTPYDRTHTSSAWGPCSPGILSQDTRDSFDGPLRAGDPTAQLLSQPPLSLRSDDQCAPAPAAQPLQPNAHAQGRHHCSPHTSIAALSPGRPSHTAVPSAAWLCRIRDTRHGSKTLSRRKLPSNFPLHGYPSHTPPVCAPQEDGGRMDRRVRRC